MLSIRARFVIHLHVFCPQVNIFKGITLPDAPKFGKVFGGQFIGQVLLVFFFVDLCRGTLSSAWFSSLQIDILKDMFLN